MKFRTLIAATTLTTLLLVGCEPSTSSSISSSSVSSYSSTLIDLNTVPQHVVDEEYKSFLFFWETTNDLVGSTGYGMVRDRYPGNPSLASIGALGFGLSAVVIGVERGWITYEEGAERIDLTFDTLLSIPRWNGYYYHFYTMSGQPASGSEISTVDTALAIMGVLHSGFYFGGDILAKARTIYEGVNWPALVEPSTVALPRFYMAYNVNTQTKEGRWDYYAEQLMMYFLAAGSPTYPITRKTYSSFTRHSDTSQYTGESYIHSWFGSIFTYQYSHAWIDFRNIEDHTGVNWFDNSVKAVKDNHAYAVANPEGFETWSSLAWGMSAGDSPDGYDGFLGAPLSGSNNSAHRNDGTIVPYGALASIVFTPEEAIASSEYYTNELGENLIGPYGYKSGFNFESTQWYAPDVIGIDKGVTLLMIENYRSNMIWNHFMEIDYMQTAIDVLDFTADVD